MLVEASKVINDPKCNKGPKCNFFGSLYAYGHKKISQRLLLALLQVPGGGGGTATYWLNRYVPL